jgi:hypothetical protein
MGTKKSMEALSPTPSTGVFAIFTEVFPVVDAGRSVRRQQHAASRADVIKVFIYACANI